MKLSNSLLSTTTCVASIATLLAFSTFSNGGNTVMIFFGNSSLKSNEGVFDASTITTTQYVKNLYTNKQYKWENNLWTSTYEGQYNPGFWRLNI